MFNVRKRTKTHSFRLNHLWFCLMQWMLIMVTACLPQLRVWCLVHLVSGCQKALLYIGYSRALLQCKYIHKWPVGNVPSETAETAKTCVWCVFRCNRKENRILFICALHCHQKLAESDQNPKITYRVPACTVGYGSGIHPLVQTEGLQDGFPRIQTWTLIELLLPFDIARCFQVNYAFFASFSLVVPSTDQLKQYALIVFCFLQHHNFAILREFSAQSVICFIFILESRK